MNRSTSKFTLQLSLIPHVPYLDGSVTHTEAVQDVQDL